MGRLCPKGVPCLGQRCIKGQEFHDLKYRKLSFRYLKGAFEIFEIVGRGRGGGMTNEYKNHRRIMTANARCWGWINERIEVSFFSDTPEFLVLTSTINFA